MSGDEKIVRDSWAEIVVTKGGEVIAQITKRWEQDGWVSGSTVNIFRWPDMSAAARFTEELFRQIDDIEEEIVTTRQWRGILRDDSNQALAHDRILTRLQAIHADLKRGLR